MGVSAAIEVSLADIREDPTTGNDFRDCANRRFAIPTAMFEDAIEVVTWGQSSRLNPTQLVDRGHRPQMVTQDIAVVTEATTIIAKLGVSQRGNPRHPAR
jgi:hypothetical protein